MFNRKKDLEDVVIIADIRKGGADRERIATYLYRNFVGYVYKGIQKYRLSEEDAKDAYGDAVVALIDHIIGDRFEGRSKVSTYLFQIFSNKCVDRIRKNTTEKGRQEKDWIFDLPEVVDESRDFVKKLMTAEDFAYVKGLTGELGEKCRELIWSADYWGYTPEEIAKRMDFKNAKTAITAKYKCMERLRKLIRQRQPNMNSER